MIGMMKRLRIALAERREACFIQGNAITGMLPHAIADDERYEAA